MQCATQDKHFTYHSAFWPQQNPGRQAFYTLQLGKLRYVKKKIKEAQGRVICL